MIVIAKYFYRIVQLWLFWAWAPALDLLAFVSDPYIPNFTFSRETYLAVALIGFIVANIKLFADQEKNILNLESREADIRLTSSKDPWFTPSSVKRCPPFSPESSEDIFSDQGIPYRGKFGAWVKLTNPSPKSGKLAWQVVKLATKPKQMFVIDTSNHGYFDRPISEIRGESEREETYAVCILIAERDPLAFARALSKGNQYTIVLKYWTERLNGTSPQHILKIRGDLHEFRREVIEYWESIGRTDLIKVAQPK